MESQQNLLKELLPHGSVGDIYAARTLKLALRESTAPRVVAVWGARGCGKSSTCKRMQSSIGAACIVVSEDRFVRGTSAPLLPDGVRNLESPDAIVWSELLLAIESACKELWTGGHVLVEGALLVACPRVLSVLDGLVVLQCSRKTCRSRRMGRRERSDRTKQSTATYFDEVAWPHHEKLAQELPRVTAGLSTVRIDSEERSLPEVVLASLAFVTNLSPPSMQIAAPRDTHVSARVSRASPAECHAAVRGALHARRQPGDVLFACPTGSASHGLVSHAQDAQYFGVYKAPTDDILRSGLHERSLYLDSIKIKGKTHRTEQLYAVEAHAYCAALLQGRLPAVEALCHGLSTPNECYISTEWERLLVAIKDSKALFASSAYVMQLLGLADSELSYRVRNAETQIALARGGEQEWFDALQAASRLLLEVERVIRGNGPSARLDPASLKLIAGTLPANSRTPTDKDDRHVFVQPLTARLKELQRQAKSFKEAPKGHTTQAIERWLLGIRHNN